MESASEIQSNLNNLKYYAEKIASLVKTQFEKDYKRGQELGVNAGPGSIRFDSLGEMISDCSRIDIICDDIARHQHNAESQDKLLHAEEVEKAQEELL